MEKQSNASCWGVMAWTIVALGGVFALVHLIGGFGAEVAMR